MSFDALLANADRLTREQLGESIVYTPGTGSPVTVDGVFDDAFVVAGMDVGEAGIATSGPAVFLTLTDLPSDPQVDTAATVTRVKTGLSYTTHTPRPDGQGAILLLLHEL